MVSFSSVNALGIYMGQHAPDSFPIDDSHPARPRNTYKVHPDVPWRGGPELDTDPFKALVDNSKATRMLGWQPKYTWRGTA